MNKFTKKLAHLRQKEHKRLRRAKWHPYPKEKPQAKCGTPFKIKLANGIVYDSYWRGEPSFEWQYYDDADVVAWAELPKAYGEANT